MDDIKSTASDDEKHLRDALRPVVDMHCERFEPGKPTNRERLVQAVVERLPRVLDEVASLRGDVSELSAILDAMDANDVTDVVHRWQKDTAQLEVERAQLRSELAEAHDALTAARAEVVDLRAALDATTNSRNGNREARLSAEAERDAYCAMLCDLLASAHPHPVEHPTMAEAWGRAREVLRTGAYVHKAPKEVGRG